MTPIKLERQDVIEILAGFRRGPIDDPAEKLDSLERAWLIDRIEQRFGVELDLDDARLTRMTTIDDALEVLSGWLQENIDH